MRSRFGLLAGTFGTRPPRHEPLRRASFPRGARHPRDVVTLDDLFDVTAPAPVEPGDVVATAEHVYRIEVVPVPPPGAPVTPVLARPVELAIAARPRGGTG